MEILWQINVQVYIKFTEQLWLLHGLNDMPIRRIALLAVLRRVQIVSIVFKENLVMQKKFKLALFLLSIFIKLSLYSSLAMAATTVNLAHQPTSFLSTAIRDSTQGITIKEISRSEDANKTLHVRFQEMYLGVPVYGGDSVLHIQHADKNLSIKQFIAKHSSTNFYEWLFLPALGN